MQDQKNIPIVKKLISELNGCNTVLDLGCGQSSLLQYVPNIKFSTGVDIWKPYIEETQLKNIHTEYVNIDITKFIPDRKYDAIICIDVLEHLQKDDALKLLSDAKKWAKKIIIYVPNGFLHNDDLYNSYQQHLSEWTPKEFYNIGFEVIGFDGYKTLRGEGGNIKPIMGIRIISSILSYLSEPFCKYNPDYAFHLLAIYNGDT